MREELGPSDPARVGKYRLIGRLGSGGMGEVFLGRSPGGRLVAVKLIRSDLARNPDFRERFAREVTSARRVGGIFTTPVVDADPDAEQPWLVTAYVPGRSLDEAVERQGPMPAEWVLRLAAGLAEGVAAIHAAGVVHRDLKPSNVMLSPDGPRIIDFGISRAMDIVGSTHSGSVVGSPGFMAPEQAQGRPIGPPCDIFALGSVLTFAATGEGPFGSGLPAILLYRIVHTAPNTVGVPAEIRPLVDRCLAKDPAARPTAEEVLAEVGASGAQGRLADDPIITLPGSHPAADPGAIRPTARRQRRGNLRLAYSLGAAALVVAASVFVGLHLYAKPTSLPSKTHGSSADIRRTAASALRPQSVVRAYFAAINQRDFARAWRLGADNLGEPYSSFVAGFAKTRRVEIMSLHSAGGTVKVRTLSYETTGQVQKYAFSYVVQHGVIVMGQTTLLTTSP